ncbi:MAG: IPT/TIG domain-containing protein [Planctomycetota bacterium]
MRPHCRNLFLLSWILVWPGTSVSAAFTLQADPFLPPESSYLGKTPFEIRGSGFSSRLEVTIGGTTLLGADLSIEEGGTVVRGTIPANTRGWEEGPQRVVLYDSGDASRREISGAFQYLGPISVLNPVPFYASPSYPTRMSIPGVGFTPETRVRAYDPNTQQPSEGTPLSDVRFLDARTLTATFPSGFSPGNYRLYVSELHNNETVAASGGGVSVSANTPFIRDVQPRSIPAEGGAELVITGQNLTTAGLFRLGPQNLGVVSSDPDGTRVTVTTPAINAGRYGVDAMDSRARFLFSRFHDIEVVETQTLEVSGVTPNRISYLGGVALIVEGQGFRDGTQVLVDGVSTIVTSTAETSMRAVLPVQTSTAIEPGRNVVLEVRQGENVARLDEAIYIDGPLSIDSVSPGTAELGVPLDLRVTGHGFSGSTRLELIGPNGSRQLGARLTGTTEFLASSTVLAEEGSYDVRVTVRDAINREIEAVLADAIVVEASEPATLSGVTPRRVRTDASSEIVVFGSGLSDRSRIYLDDGNLVSLNVRIIDESHLRVVVPPHPSGVFDLVLADQGGEEVDRLSGAVEYISPLTTSVEQVEASVVDGVARLDWLNPKPFKTIEIYRDGQRADVLPGSTTRFVDPRPVAQQAEYEIVAIAENDTSGRATLQVAPWRCRPADDSPFADRGPIDFRVLGGHSAFGAGGGGGALPDGHQQVRRETPIVTVDPDSGRVEYDIDPEFVGLD